MSYSDVMLMTCEAHILIENVSRAASTCSLNYVVNVILLI